MPRTIQWLEFLSQKERERRQQAAQRRLLPKGEEQRAAELELLRAVVHTRAGDSDLMFQLLQAKECLNAGDSIESAPEAEAERQSALREWQQSALARRFAREELAAFLALAQAEREMNEFDASLLPTPEQLQARAKSILQENISLF